MRVLISDLAVQEIQDAAEYLEMQFEGLARAFKDEVERSIELIRRHPTAWSIERGDIRRCLLHRFPYKLLYAIAPDHIVILAAAHQHREPDYWVDRQ